MEGVFGSLAVVLVLAAGGGILARLVKLPVVLGYILAGVIIGEWNSEARIVVAGLGQVGVTFLLFLVGLELPIWELKKMGRVAVVTGLGQVGVTSVLGFFLARFLGFGVGEAVILGVALTFSSTIIVVKILSEKGDLRSLHGKIAVGSLLVQDFVAMGILVAMAGVSRGGGWQITSTIAMGLKAAVIVGLVIWLSVTVLPRLWKWLATSPEILFGVSVAWCMGVAAVVASKWVGFSAEIGGLLAGLALSSVAAHLQITARVKPVRDFFLTLFFVALGADLTWAGVSGLGWPVVVLSGYVLIGNPVIMMTILGWMGYGRRTAFLAGITMGQISELSLVVAAIATRTGLVSTAVLPVVTVVGVVTMVFSSYCVEFGEKLYRIFGRRWVFWVKKGRELTPNGVDEEPKSEVILFGHNRVGSVLLPVLKKLGEVVVVDFDPTVVEKLAGEGERVVYGDMADVEIYDRLGMAGANLVVSTVDDRLDNLQLLSEARNKGRRGLVVVVTAADRYDARLMYEAGADYVLIPHGVGGDFLAGMIEAYSRDHRYLSERGQVHRGGLGKHD